MNKVSQAGGSRASHKSVPHVRVVQSGRVIGISFICHEERRCGSAGSIPPVRDTSNSSK